jgi:hypothetical protein
MENLITLIEPDIKKSRKITPSDLFDSETKSSSPNLLNYTQYSQYQVKSDIPKNQREWTEKRKVKP